MDVTFGNKELRLNMFGASQGPSMDSCFEVDTLEDIIEDATPTILAPDPLDTCLAHFGVYDFEGYMKEVNTLLDTPHDKITPPWTIKYEPLLTLASTPIVPSLESSPMLELKPLPAMLKYVFLGSNDTLLAIIALDLTPNQEA